MPISTPASPRFLAVPLLAGLAVVGIAGTQPAAPDPEDPELRQIIDRALERAAWAEEEGFETRYRRAMTQRIRQFDGDGEVTDDETLLYALEPHQGALFSRLMARDGAPLDARGRREQERRWDEFQAEITDPEKRAERERRREENEIKFDEEMVGRFTATKVERVLFGSEAAGEISVEVLPEFSYQIRADVARDLEIYPSLSLLDYAEIIDR